MAKLTARNAYMSASYANSSCADLSGDLNQITMSQTREAPEVTVFGDTNRQRLPEGIETWEITFDGYYQGGTNQIDEALFTMLSASNVVRVGPTGCGAGGVKFSGCGVLSNYEIGFTLDGAVTVTGTVTARSGSLTKGAF